MFERINLSAEKCSKCGASYGVVKVSLPVKDKDTFECLCGNELRKWKETASYEYTLQSRSTDG